MNGQGAILDARGISKSFGRIRVLQDVDFDVFGGEVHALVGENGAGKSTLMNILAGVLQPDTGEIRWLGRTHTGFASASAAQRLGVAMVYQERSLFGPLTVAENIFAGRQPVHRWGQVDRSRLRAEAQAGLAQVAPEVSPDAILDTLAPAQQQMVEIAKALSLQARLVILDEPTAALSETETARLFRVIRELKRRSIGVVYISHRLEEVFRLADRVTVLKDGVDQGTLPVVSASPAELIRRMVGRELGSRGAVNTAPAGEVLLEVRGLSDPRRLVGARPQLRDINLKARAGEIVGLAGLAGAGRTELALTLFGARPRGAGESWLHGQPFAPGSPADAIRAGLGYLTEDRKELGLFPEMSVARNVAAASLRRFGGAFYHDARERAVADDFRERLRVVSRDADQEVGRLSGGNQQKVLFARWLLVHPTVLIADEPTRGVDVGAKAELHELLRDFARNGGSVLVLSSELPELLALSDRIYVMRSGRIAGELARAEASEERVLRLAALELA
jgi:ABC-type sugar transport system ATPase subunit